MRTPAQNGEKMRTYLVTGGAGFIGSNYIHYMFKKYDNEIRIINVDALRAKSSCMYLRMRSTDLFPMMTMLSSMRPRLTIPTVLTPQVRQARTCW